jgi:hypothetical protein
VSSFFVLTTNSLHADRLPSGGGYFLFDLVIDKTPARKVLFWWTNALDVKTPFKKASFMRHCKMLRNDDFAPGYGLPNPLERTNGAQDQNSSVLDFPETWQEYMRRQSDKTSAE